MLPSIILQIASLRDAATNYVAGIVTHLPAVAAALVVFTLFYLASDITKSMSEKSLTRVTKDKRAGKALSRIIQYMVLLVGLVAALAVAGVNLGALMLAVGAVGFAIAFGMQETIGNLIAGLIILSTHPFASGDRVDVGGEISGTVETVGIRATKIRTFDGIRAEVPNRNILGAPIKVLNFHPTRRIEAGIGIGYDDDIPSAIEAIVEAVEPVEGVLSEPEPEVLVDELGGSSVNLKLRFWTDTRPDAPPWRQTRTKAIRAAKEGVEARGIDIPFPIRTVYFHDETAGRNGDGDAGRNDDEEGDGEQNGEDAVEERTGDADGSAP